MSYRKKYVKSRIQKIKPKKSIFVRPWFWIIILALAFISGVVYFGLFFSGVQVKTIQIAGNQKVQGGDVKNLVEQNLDVKIISAGNWQVNSKSIFFINLNIVRDEIMQKFPLIESVQVRKKFFQTLDIIISERTAVAVFCGIPREGADCYLIDSSGTIFEPVAGNEQNLMVVSQANLTGDIFAGVNAINASMLDFILKIQRSLKEVFQIDLQRALIASPVRVNVTTSEGWQAYFNFGQGPDIDSQLLKLSALLLDQLNAQSRENLRYIDLRFKDKAIVCDNDLCGAK